MPQVVITAVGPDRPGLVDELSGYLLEQCANIADSRMVNLRGQFAVILLTETPDAGVATKVCDSADEIGRRTKLHVTAWPDEHARGTPEQGLAFRLKTSSMDQPGIVHRITHLLHNRQVNIEELNTRLEPGSYTGTPRFSMDMCISVPADLPIKQLRRELAELCDSLNCDMELHPA